MKEIILSNIWFFIIAFLIGLVIGLIFWLAGRQRVKNIETDMEVLQKRLNAEVEEKEEWVRKLKEAKSTHNQSLVEINDLKANLRDKDAELQRLRYNPPVSKKDPELEQKLADATAENAELKDGLLKSNKQRKEVIAALKAFKAKVDSGNFSSSFDEKAFRGMAQKRIKDLEDQVAKFTDERKVLQTKVANSDMLRVKLERENLKLDTKLRDLLAELTLLKTQD